MVAAKQHRYTPEEYLALERKAEFKSEYLDGQVYAMAGSSPDHSAITANLTVAIGIHLRSTPCRVFNSDLKVRTSSTGLYSYPDLTVVCGELRFHDEHRDVLTNPTVIFEVLSPSTEAFDRDHKRMRYQQIETLTDYILIAQDSPAVEHFSRQAENRWQQSILEGLNEALDLASLGCTVQLADIYDRIVFPTLPDPSEQSKTPDAPAAQ